MHVLFIYCSLYKLIYLIFDTKGKSNTIFSNLFMNINLNIEFHKANWHKYKVILTEAILIFYIIIYNLYE